MRMFRLHGTGIAIKFPANAGTRNVRSVLAKAHRHSSVPARLQTGTSRATEEIMSELEIILIALAFTLAVAHGYICSKSRRESGKDGG
jgi:hypothetical protein